MKLNNKREYCILSLNLTIYARNNVLLRKKEMRKRKASLKPNFPLFYIWGAKVKCPRCKSLKVVPRPESIGGGYFYEDCGKRFGLRLDENTSNTKNGNACNP